MKHKLGILTALILSLAIAGSAFAAPGTKAPQQSKTTSSKKMSMAKTKKTSKRRKHRKAKTAKTMKAAPTTSNSKK